MRRPNQQRRRAQRNPVRWDARYRVDPEGTWIPCTVVDLSLGGAALELLHDAEVPRDRFAVDVRPAPNGREGFVLTGEVRNLRRGPRGRQRIGVEFMDPTEIQSHVLADLLDVESYRP